jgi:hypothetical protein
MDGAEVAVATPELSVDVTDAFLQELSALPICGLYGLQVSYKTAPLAKNVN